MRGGEQVVDIVVKRKFTVIGKMGEGLAAEGAVWIPPLWKEANRNFDEISQLAKLNSDGSMVGIWGAMSDLDEKFERWKKEGKYLAGCEVLDDAEAPNDWVKWVIPSFKYVVVKCNQNSYQEIFNYIIEDYLPNHAYSLVGAVHEFYDPKDNNGDLSLFFPIEKV